MGATALVTGASGGIGEEFAKILASYKYDVILVARSLNKLQEIKKSIEKEFGVKVHALAKDLSQPGAASEVYSEVQEKGFSIEILVNNAGFGDFGKFNEAKWDKQVEMINLNVLALTHLTKLFLKDMVALKRGRILNLASTAAFQPGPLMAVYYATKAYVLSFSEAIANELRGTGVTVTTLCPGPTASGFQQAADLGESKLVKGRKMPTSREVAKFGIDAMMRGKTVVVHGGANRMMVQSLRFLPRKVVTSLVRKVQET